MASLPHGSCKELALERDKHHKRLDPATAAPREPLAILALALRVPPDELLASKTGVLLHDFARRMAQHNRDRDAPVREVMARVGDRWSTLILLILSTGTFGHAMLRRLIVALSAERAISQRMLTLKLRALERDGFVIRTVTPVLPPKVDYTLSPMGQEFVTIVEGLLKWIERHEQEIHASQDKFEAGDA